MAFQNSNAASTEVNLSIAGIGVGLICNHPGIVAALRSRYRDFLVKGPIDMRAEIEYQGQERSSSLLDIGIQFAGRRMQLTERGYRGFIDPPANIAQLQLSSNQPVEDIEYFLRIIYAALAFENQGFLFHAAGIVKDERAFLFFGHSGSGKTTVSRLSEPYRILNDDLLLLLPEKSNDPAVHKWIAYSTPFWNPTQVKPSPSEAPVVGLFRLVQSKNVFLEEMSKGQALAEIFSNIPVLPDDPEKSQILMIRSLDLLSAIPCYRLYFLPDRSFWEVVDPATSSPPTP